MTEDLDDLTLIYMYGYKNGKQIMKDEIDRLREALRGVIAVADRDCPEFRKARAALAGEATDDAAP